MYCNQCGAVISVADHYCPICGASAPSIPQRLSDSQHKKNIRTERTRQNKSFKRYFLLLLIIGSIGATAYFFTQKTSPSVILYKNKSKQKVKNKQEKEKKSHFLPESFDKISDSLSFGEDNEAKKACKEMILELNKNKTIIFSDEVSLNHTGDTKTNKSWLIKGTFKEKHNGKTTKKRYSCQVSITENKKQQPKMHAAVLVN